MNERQLAVYWQGLGISVKFHNPRAFGIGIGGGYVQL
jgi:hypothetical protein